MVRKAEERDLPDILIIYDRARAFMRASGNTEQWRNGYPCREALEYDIEQGRLFVLEDDFGLYGVFMLALGPDRTYSVIRDGRWLDDSEYAVIHRIASSGRRRGVLHEALSYASGLCSHIRIDTHALNAPMQRALEREGFVRTGIIVCDDGTDRVAFERVPTCVADK